MKDIKGKQEYTIELTKTYLGLKKVKLVLKPEWKEDVPIEVTKEQFHNNLEKQISYIPKQLNGVKQSRDSREQIIANMRKINASQVVEEGQKGRWTTKLNGMTDEELRAERDKYTQKTKFITSTKDYDGGKHKGLAQTE